MNNKHLFQFPVILFVFGLLAACGGSGGGLGGGGGGGTITSITVTPADPSLPLGRITQLVATTNKGADITAAGTTTWNSSNTAVATVTATGLVAPAGGATAGQTATLTATDTVSGVFGTTVVTIATAPTTFTVGGVSDPLAAQQWHLNNTGQAAYADSGGVAGQDINVNSVYSSYGIDGTGVTVAVVDSGLEIAHEDLGANVVPGGSWDFVSNDTDPTNPDPTGDHGTAVAGLIAADRNSVGGIGVASGASLKGFNPLENQSNANFADSLGGSAASPNSRDVSVFNQSYGVSFVMPVSVPSAIEDTLAYGVNNLRNGKGALYVKAAGNGYDDNGFASYGLCDEAIIRGLSCENVNVDEENTLPYNIVVGAVNADGLKSSYSTSGSALWVSATGGEFGANNSIVGGAPAYVYEPAMISTDQSGCGQGYSRTGVGYSTFDRGGAPNTSCNYTNGMNGTSSATPVTVGVIALMLEANPALTWRDVKHILASTSTQVNAAKAAISINLSNGSYVVEPAWVTNFAGYHFHNWYGFGRVNAAAAVAAARTYVYGSLGTFQNTGWLNSGTVNAAIPDNSTAGASHVIVVPDALTVEAVQIRVSATHPWVGDLTFELTSPVGTRSVLKTSYDGMANNGASGFNNFQLASNAFYGEPAAGDWTLKVVDGWAVGTGTFNNWKIKVYGH